MPSRRVERGESNSLSESGFPAPSAGHSDLLLGGGGFALASTDRPEVREVMRFLLSPEFGVDWFGSGAGALSPNRRFDRANYDPFWREQADLLDAALAADTFRYDGSDLMPPPIGDELFSEAMVRYVEDGPDSLDGILAELEAAWPDDG